MKSFNISGGPIWSVDSLLYSAGKDVENLVALLRKEQTAGVHWDLLRLEPRRTSIAGLSALLAEADLIKSLGGKPQTVSVDWNREVLSFLDDTDFIRISKELDLLQWNEEILGGYPTGILHPYTKIRSFLLEVPPFANRKEEDDWKEMQQDKKSKELFHWLVKLITESEFSEYEDELEELMKLIANALAELIVNSSLHGRARCFVAFQRGRGTLSLAVNDGGIGFLQTIRSRYKHLAMEKTANDIEALVGGSMINPEKYGLRRLIGEVVSRNGIVQVSSNRGEVRWGYESWDKAIRIASESTEISHKVALEVISQVFKGVTKGSATEESKRRGFLREWSHGLPGSRVVIEFFRSKRGAIS